MLPSIFDVDILETFVVNQISNLEIDIYMYFSFQMTPRLSEVHCHLCWAPEPQAAYPFLVHWYLKISITMLTG